MQDMNLKIPYPFLVYDFVDRDGFSQKRVFSNPIEVISVNSVDEVHIALEQVQQWVEKGYYAAGYLSYEAAPAFDAAFVVRPDHKMPLLWFGIFSETGTSIDFPRENRFEFSPWASDTTPDDYIRNVQAIKNAISQGETYQVNYTIRLRSRWAGDDLGYYNYLRNVQQANYSAYLNIGRFRILSVSPELFFRLDGRTITTRPMKGTIQRGRWLEEDEALASWLFESEKNRAENIMIVDLLRNDLSKIPGVTSVEVPQLFEIERYPTLHQMTSTITALACENSTFVDVLEALFPCGSITGAPKISTMQIISELERHPREIYCGTVGFIEPSGDAIFNVAIRSIYIDSETERAEYGVGGGITWDSTTEDEYAEAFAKAALLDTPNYSFELLETLKLNRGQYVLLNRHIERLASSARFFNFPVDLDAVAVRLSEHASEFEGMSRRVRLIVSQTGAIHIESSDLPDLSHELQTVAVATRPVSKQNKFLYHKTTHRDVYQFHQNFHADVFDVLLWNEDGQITEFTNGNIVLEIDDHKVTPSRGCGLLAGTFRAQLLDEGIIHERELTHSDLRRATLIWFINSVRGWVPVQFVK